MTDPEALDLLRAAVPEAAGEAWAELGAGGGVFTRALAALVGAAGHVYAVDADARAVSRLRAWAVRAGAPVTALVGDVRDPLPLPPLDGLLMANVLHFLDDAEGALARAGQRLVAGGRVVIIEYEGRRASPWVPYPVSTERLPSLAAAAGLTRPEVVATRPSAFGGSLYVALAQRVA